MTTTIAKKMTITIITLIKAMIMTTMTKTNRRMITIITLVMMTATIT